MSVIEGIQSYVNGSERMWRNWEGKAQEVQFEWFCILFKNLKNAARIVLSS